MVSARKAKGDGAKWAKARRKVAKVYARITDRRRDHLHKGLFPLRPPLVSFVKTKRS